MANTFTATKAWRVGGPEGKSLLKIQGVLAIDTTASGGAAADDLPASLFGLNKIVESSPAVNDGEDKVYPTSPDYTGDSLLVGGGVAQALVDLPNDNYKMTVTGY